MNAFKGFFHSPLPALLFRELVDPGIVALPALPLPFLDPLLAR